MRKGENKETKRGKRGEDKDDGRERKNDCNE
jgi:hypothetical protein